MPSPTPSTTNGTVSPRASFSFDSLQFIPCSDDTMLAQSWSNSRLEFGTEFSEDEWIQMSREMLASDLVEPGWFQLFVVTSKDDPERNLLTSCAIHVVDAIVGSSPSTPSGNEGKETGEVETKLLVEDVKCATVVRVVTPARYRGHGYGGWMMKQLWRYLEQRPDIQLSNFDVGDYYTRKGGWRWFSSDIIRIPVNDFEAMTGTAGSVVESLPSAVPITDDLLDEVVAHDAAHIRQEIQARCQSSVAATADDEAAKTVVVAIRPHTRIIRWFRLRKEYDLALMKRRGLLDKSVQLDAYGAMIPLAPLSDSNTASHHRPLSHILWCQDVVDKRFRIQRFCHGTRKDSAQDRAEAMALLLAVVKEAKRLKVERIEIWNPHPTLQEWLGLQAVDRKIPLSNLGLCPGPMDPEGQSASSRIEWIHNEFYPCL
ncbi:hypothetical protein BGZ73_005929 [Actinomortierella ambigua]|nr:hypothetical protein BGZ73_005929 [Actinomortierella ambigua]